MLPCSKNSRVLGQKTEPGEKAKARPARHNLRSNQKDAVGNGSASTVSVKNLLPCFIPPLLKPFGPKSYARMRSRRPVLDGKKSSRELPISAKLCVFPQTSGSWGSLKGCSCSRTRFFKSVCLPWVPHPRNRRCDHGQRHKRVGLHYHSLMVTRKHTMKPNFSIEKHS